MKLLRLAAIAGLLLVACAEDQLTHDNLSPGTTRSLQALSDKRIFFGHQSVGSNVLDGLAGLQGLSLPIVNVRDSGSIEIPIGPALLHTSIGSNTRPDVKVSDFADLMRSGVAEAVDVSFMKFCYVDTGHELSAEQIFQQYMSEMAKLESEYPQTTFVYLTMPLTAPRTDIKGRIKRLLGMDSSGREDNIERKRFNDLVRERVGDTGRLFDIATIESTHPDGRRETFRRDGQMYYAMVPAYTDDGGHLNERGRRIVAEELVRFLADL